MGEILTDHNMPQNQGPEQSSSPDAPVSYRERLRRAVGVVAERSMSLVNNAAAIALAHDDLRLTRRAMNAMDEPYDGLLARQASADPVSPQLESALITHFNRGAAQAGYDDAEALSAEARIEVAQAAVAAQRGDLAIELATLHPEWSSDELNDAVQARAADIVMLFSMTPDQRANYRAAQQEYDNLQSAVPDIQAELSDLRAERNQRLGRIGRAALSGVVDFAGRVRDLPNALSARAVVAGMGLADRIRQVSAETRHKALWGTAAGVALAGLAAYVAVRSGRGVGSGAGNYVLASDSSTIPTDHIGTVASPTEYVGGAPANPEAVGSQATIPTEYVGSPAAANHVGTAAGPLPTEVGSSATPNHVGGNAQVPGSHVGGPSSVPGHHVGGAEAVPGHHVGGGAEPNQHVGAEPNIPTSVGGGEGLHPANSNELFSASGNEIPDTVKVSRWNAQNLDGSLYGISRQMLVRSGMVNPTDTQVGALVDSLRPQAQANGHLLYEQTLDLRPAKQVLETLV